jgi:hypothetical protein
VQDDPHLAATVRQELDAVLSSPGFARNPRMSRFLRFLVERHLEGRDNELKESLIAYEVFGRKPDYDPKQDSIVRTEAARLRARLAEHYARPGRKVALIIDVPKGGYLPTFQYRESAAAETASIDPRDQSARNGLIRRVLVIAAICLAIALGGAALRSLYGQHPPIPIGVLPLANLGTEPSGDAFADGLTDEIIGNLSVIDGLAVRSRTSSFSAEGAIPRRP